MDIDKNGYYYRTAKIEDYSQISYLLSMEFDINLSYDNYLQILAKNNTLFLVALDNDSCVGFLSGEMQNDLFSGKRRMFMNYGAVRAEYRKKGVFRHLFEIVGSWAKEANASTIELTCAMHRSESHKFYFNNGFTIKKTFVFIKELK